MKTVNTTTTEIAIERIRKSAKHMPEVRVIKVMKIGQVIRQGDVYLEKVKDSHPHKKEHKGLQLAPGTSKGSRHCIHENPKIKLFLPHEEFITIKGKRFFQGPVIKAGAETTIESVLVTHPEHAFCKIPPGTYQTRFQTDIARQQRVRD